MTTDLLTVSEKTKSGIQWKVDWTEFDKADATVSDVQAELNEFAIDIKDVLIRSFSSYPRLLEQIKSISFDSGTIIKISSLNDSWENERIEKLFANLEILLPPNEQPDFNIQLFCTDNIDHFGKVKTAYYDDFDYKIEASYKAEENRNLEIKISRNELDLDALQDRYSDVFRYDAMKVFPYRLEDFKARTFTLNVPLDKLFPKSANAELIEKVGSFDFTFYFLKLTASDDRGGDIRKFPYKSFSTANRKAWLKRFGGVKIFRDDFRIRPYGENGDDWLMLGERQAQSPGGAGQRLGGYRIGPNQIAGTINISRLRNLSFQDKSGREGIIENDVFEFFKNILKEIISFFEKDRNVIMFHLAELYKQKNKEEEAKRKAQEEAERVKQEQEEKAQTEQDSSQSSERENTLATGVQILTKELVDKDDEIRLLRSLASVGLIISSFAHEVKSLRSRLIPRTTFLLRELSNYLDEQSLKDVDKDDNPFYMIRLMQEEDTKLKHWLDYSLNTLKRDKRERTNLDFSYYFETFKATWNKALLQRGISLKITGEKNSTIRAFEVDMDSIFNNLLSNSMNALKGLNKREKTVSISWKKVNENIEIFFSDNGKGLDRQYKDNPEQIFNLNESSKKDKKGNIIGTGLGLYIVKSIIEEYNNSNISIIGAEEGLRLKITFKTRK